jgi:very-short-patch-repair endonuclease
MSKPSPDGLIALLKDKSDLAILQQQGWYRVPVDTAPRRWPPTWIGFYQPKNFGPDAYRVRYFGRVRQITQVPRRELFPNELPSARSARLYHRVTFERLEERAAPVRSLRARRLTFIPTTWDKFIAAEQINDLFDDSPLEDRLWERLKQLDISAERQWTVQPGRGVYHLDFAIFCQKGSLDIETDGDTWHAARERIDLDNQRDTELSGVGWTVHRFNGLQIREKFSTYCVPQIESTINHLGGVADGKIVPQLFHPAGKDSARQMSLFERDETGYIVEAGDSLDLD